MTIPRWLFLMPLLLSLFGCASNGPDNLRELSEEFSTVWGRVVAPPSVQGSRLFLYVQVAADENSKNGPILVCVAENEEKTEILQRLADSVAESDKPLYLFGQKIQGQWKEYTDGLDFEIYAVGYYNPKAQKYQTVITTYGTGLSDMLRSFGWGNFLKAVGKKALDTAM